MHPLITDICNNACPVYVALSVILLSVIYYFYSNRGLPPGPTGLPYIGYYPFMDQNACHVQMHELTKKYGDIFSFTVTGTLFIHLGSLKAAREVHLSRSDCFADRLTGYNILYAFLEGGVVYLKGDGWKTSRKFFLQQFRDRGMNVIKDALSGPIYDCVRNTVNDLKKKNGEPADIASILLVKCNKIMRETLLGGDGMTEQEMKEFNDLYCSALMSMTSTSLLLNGTIAKYFLIPFAKNFRKGQKEHQQMKDMLYKVINKRKSTFDEHNVRDAIDAFFKEKMELESKNSPMAKFFTDKILMVSLIQIIGDGVLFMSMFISAFIKAVVDHPEEQEKMYKELMEVCGDRDPGLEDKGKLPYINAFLTEVQRTTEVFTFFPSLECKKETTVRGYRIPKGANTVYNFYSAHLNTDDYEEPEKFKPSRFLVEEGKKKEEILTLFGVGKRSCMGEGFVMIQAFLFLTTIVKNFRLTKPTGQKDANLLYFNSETLLICATPRVQK